MNRYVALLRAVNVGGTGKLPMSILREMCVQEGFENVRTHIASGNAVFRSAESERHVQAALETRLQTYAGKPVGVLVRSAEELEGVLARNPFADKPGNRTVVLFVDEPLSPAALEDIKGRKQEELRIGLREIFIFYGCGMANSRLRIPAAKNGTARNMNTVAKLVEMARTV